MNERVCNTYIPRSKTAKRRQSTTGAEPKCVCGRERTDPLHKVYEKEGVKWNKTKHTSERRTGVFGKLSLPGGVQANFVKISDKTSMATVATLLTEKWKIKKP